MLNPMTVISFKSVYKKYQLFKNSRARFKSIFLKNIAYNEKIVLNNINFEIDSGESVAFLGKNGAGKSTILKLITGVIYPTSGEIKINGKVGALLELTSGLIPEFSGVENIRFHCTLLGFDKEKLAQIEKKVIEFADIGEYVNQPVRMYSSGMKARLGFAINTNIEPNILIVDEALSVGDKNFNEKCYAKINEIMHKNTTFLFVTHSTFMAKKYCKRGIVLNGGKVSFDGAIDKACEYYEKNVLKGVKI